MINIAKGITNNNIMTHALRSNRSRSPYPNPSITFHSLFHAATTVAPAKAIITFIIHRLQSQISPVPRTQ